MLTDIGNNIVKISLKQVNQFSQKNRNNIILKFNKVTKVFNILDFFKAQKNYIRIKLTFFLMSVV